MVVSRKIEGTTIAYIHAPLLLLPETGINLQIKIVSAVKRNTAKTIFILDVFLYTPAPVQSRTTYFDRSRNSHLHRRKNSPTHNTTEVDATIYTQSAILNGTTLNIVPPNETIRI